MTKRQLKSFIEQEIEWCEKNTDTDVSKDFKNGYILALREVEKKFKIKLL